MAIIVSVVAVTRKVVLLFLFLYPLVNAGGEAAGEQDLATRESRVAKPYNVKRSDRKDLIKDHLLNKLPYCGDGGEEYKINLVEEIMRNDYYKHMATLLGLNPNAIVNSYVMSKAELEECSRRLFDKIYDKGYKGKFNWDAYIAGLKATEGLDGIAKDLENMLKCNGISTIRQEAVKPSSFFRMTCKEDGSVFSLIEEVAEHWQAVARTFGIREQTIDANPNIPERAARTVLQRLYDNGYKGELGWQGVLNLLQDTGANGIHSMLDGALDSVKLLGCQHDEL